MFLLDYSAINLLPPNKLLQTKIPYYIYEVSVSCRGFKPALYKS